MADLSDVMTALARQVGDALYPTGTANPVSPVNSAQTKIFPGWPSDTQINADLVAGYVTVSVYAGKVAKNTTRFLDGFQPTSLPMTLAREVRRAMREFQITVWSPTPQSRDTTAQAIDIALTSLRTLPLADGSQAFLRWVRDWIDDSPQKELNYQRVLVYEVEYGTFQTATATPVTHLNVAVKGGFDPSNTILNETIP